MKVAEGSCSTVARQETLTMRRGKNVVAMLALAAMLWPVVGAAASGTGQASDSESYLYHSLIPLGSESFEVEPWKTVLTVLASAESPQFEGWRRQGLGDRRGKLLDAAGQPVRHFPGTLNFRVSVGTRTRLADSEPYPLRTSLPQNDYLLHLRFRVKVFHGLQQTIVEPAAVKMIGVPDDMPYDERIYRIAFDLGEVSLDDRIVLEVLTPSGERLCKFHLDLT